MNEAFLVSAHIKCILITYVHFPLSNLKQTEFQSNQKKKKSITIFKIKGFGQFLFFFFFLSGHNLAEDP